MLDALCQALESWWSIHSTDTSINYAKKAVELILLNMDGYLGNTIEGNREMLVASNLSGKAINCTRTTAPHALSYKLTSLFGIPHGHAVALTFPPVWMYMWEHMDLIADKRGKEYLTNVFRDIASALGCADGMQAIAWFNDLLFHLQITAPREVTEEQFQQLVASVNLERLRNSPIFLDADAISLIYHKALLHA